MYEFEIDVNNIYSSTKEEDYGNILLIDFEEDSPFLIHNRYDPFKFSMLSNEARTLLQVLLEHSNYSISIATIGSNIKNLPVNQFADRFISLMKKVNKINYNWTMFVSTMEEGNFGYNDKAWRLQNWSLNHGKLFFITTTNKLYIEPFTYSITKEKPNFEAEKLAVEFSMAFNGKDKSLVEKIAEKYDEENHRSMKYNLYSVIKRYRIEEALRSNRRSYTPHDWKKLLDIIYETAVDTKNIKEYFPTIEDQEISIKYNQHYLAENKKVYEGHIFLELFFTGRIIGYNFLMLKPK